LAGLLLPADALYLLEHDVRGAVRHDLLLTDTLPLILLLAAGVAGFVHRSSRPDVLTRTGFVMGVVVFGALIVHPFRPIAALGPVSFRHTVWIELGAALSAIGWVAPRQIEPRARLTALLPFALALSGLWWGKPLRDDRPAASAEEWRELESLWRFLGQNADGRAGRVYLQDTFGQGWAGGLAHSHVLVRCHTRTHLPQLGVYYGVVPYATRWTLSEFQRLYDRYKLSAKDLDLRLKRTNVRLVVASTKEAASYFARTGLLNRIKRIGRYSVWRPKSVEGWINPVGAASEVRDVVWEVGRISFEVSSSEKHPRLLVKTSFHPWWKVEGAPGATLSETDDGLLALDVGSPGRHRVTLRYVPLRWPGLLGSAGWGILAAWGVAAVVRRKWKLD